MATRAGCASALARPASSASAAPGGTDRRAVRLGWGVVLGMGVMRASRVTGAASYRLSQIYDEWGDERKQIILRAAPPGPAAPPAAPRRPPPPRTPGTGAFAWCSN